ncbi:MAG TPA: hypothetical protein V6C76_00850 [Drouetiella sp.]
MSGNCTVCGSPLRSRGVVSYICTNQTCNTLYVKEEWRGEELRQHMWWEEVIDLAAKMHSENPSQRSLDVAKAMYDLPISSESFSLCIDMIRDSAFKRERGMRPTLDYPLETLQFLRKISNEWEYWTRGYKDKLNPPTAKKTGASMQPTPSLELDDDNDEEWDDDDEDWDDDDDDDYKKPSIGSAYCDEKLSERSASTRQNQRSDFLKRYNAGEHEAVWQDMIALGEDIRSEPIYSEAKLVAEETMKRVRTNVETLHKRLNKIKFLYNDEASFEPPDANVKTELDKIEQKIGTLPISIRAFCEQVGSVRFMGRMKPSTKVKCSYPDPLYFDLLATIWSDFDEWEVDWYEDCDPLLASFAPDSYHKADVSGGSPNRFIVPNPDADALVFSDDHKDMHFVDYLRMYCKCGGLPGLSVDHKSFAEQLAKDLLPF